MALAFLSAADDAPRGEALLITVIARINASFFMTISLFRSVEPFVHPASICAIRNDKDF
jgi:hypothetical protein